MPARDSSGRFISGVSRRDHPLWKKIQREIFAQHYVVVGIPAGPVEPDGTSVAQVAIINHYGAELPSGGIIPARPFLTAPLDGRLADVRAIIERIGGGILSGKLGKIQGLKLLGQWGRNKVVSWIDEGTHYNENAESTIRGKRGGIKPLINFGHLKGAITSEVRDGS